MKVITELLASLPEGSKVESLTVGVHWTLAVTSLGAGLASTLPQSFAHGEESVADAGRLLGRDALELARLLLSPRPLERSIGMAAANAILPVDEARCVELSAQDWLEERGKGKRVAVVGHFPFLDRLREVASQLWVLELRPREGELSAHLAEEVVPQAEVVVLTGSTLINGTFERLMSFCQPQAEVMLLGPTAPLWPGLHRHGVKVISGTRVVDPRKVEPYVAQGANFQQIRKSSGVRLLTMIDATR